MARPSKRLLLLCSFPMLAATLHAQTAGPPMRSATPWPQNNLRFADEKPVSGLAVDTALTVARCTADGRTYFDLRRDQPDATVPMLLSVSPGGEVKTVLRKAPEGFNRISVLDFFAGESDLLTLLQAEKRDDDGVVRETAYFLFNSDGDGDHPALNRLDVKFKPLKVAILASGSYIVLGWNPYDAAPVLASVKEDGTVRRFLDLTNTARTEGNSANGAEVEPALNTLQDAAFVPFGRGVLLAYPGTTRPARIVKEAELGGSIPLPLPAGYVLQAIINAGHDRSLVVRARAERSSVPADLTASSYPALRLFEMNSYQPGILKEFIFDKPNALAVTCAASYHLTAIFPDSVAGQTGSAPASQGDGAHGTPGTPDPASLPMVVSTVRR